PTTGPSVADGAGNASMPPEGREWRKRLTRLAQMGTVLTRFSSFAMEGTIHHESRLDSRNERGHTDARHALTVFGRFSGGRRPGDGRVCADFGPHLDRRHCHSDDTGTGCRRGLYLRGRGARGGVENATLRGHGSGQQSRYISLASGRRPNRRPLVFSLPGACIFLHVLKGRN